MIRHIETKPIPVDNIVIGLRQTGTPPPEDVDQMMASIQEDGLLAPIAVQNNDGDEYRLVYGATRLLAVRELGWREIMAHIFDGTDQEFDCAEVVENIKRRHLKKKQQDEMLKALVELRTKTPTKEFDDSVSRNSSGDAPPQEFDATAGAHPNAAVPGTKRGRPPTAEGKAKKKVAAETGRSLRSVQRATSKNAAPKAPSKSPVRRDEGRMWRVDRIKHLVDEIGQLLLACDSTDRDQIRKLNEPHLDGWFDDQGKLRVELTEPKIDQFEAAMLQPNDVGGGTRCGDPGLPPPSTPSCGLVEATPLGANGGQHG
jgi:hypothetical protein